MTAARVYNFASATRDSLLPATVVTAAVSGSIVSTAAGTSVSGVAGAPPAFDILDYRNSDNGGPLAESLSLGRWLSVRMQTSSTGNFAGVYFQMNGSADQDISFPIRNDGVMRTYNVWLGKYWTVPRTKAHYEAQARGAAYNVGFPGVTNKISIRASLIEPPGTVTASMTLTSGSTSAALSEANSNIDVGNEVTGTGIPAGTTVRTYAGGATTAVTLSQAATASGTVSCTFSTGGLGSPIRVYPSNSYGGSGTVSFVRVSDQPVGPACLVIDFTGPTASRMRPGETHEWGVRVHNMGGIEATGIQISVTSTDAGFTFASHDYTGRTIPPGEYRTFYFDCTFTTFGERKAITTTVSCAQGDSVTRGGVGTILPALPAGYVASLEAGVAPHPTVTPRSATRVETFIWAFISTTAQSMNHAVATASRFEYLNDLGYVDCATTVYWDWMIYYLVHIGLVNVLQFEWFWDDDRCSTTMPYFLASRNVGYVKFTLSVTIHAGTGISTTAVRDFSSTATTTIRTSSGAPGAGLGNVTDFCIDTANNRLYGPKNTTGWPAAYLTIPAGFESPTATSGYIIAVVNFLGMVQWDWMPYLGHAQYYTFADGKRQISVFNVKNFYNNMNALSVTSGAATTTDGLDWLGQIFARVGTLLTEAGLTGGVRFAGQFNNLEREEFAAIGVERSESYNSYGAPSPFHGMEPTVARSYMEGQRWNGQALSADKTTVLPLLNGVLNFDKRYWVSSPYNAGYFFDNWSYSSVITHLNALDTWLTTNVSSTVTSPYRMRLIAALGENGEGEQAEPTGRTGFDTLLAMRRSAAPGLAFPTFVTPVDMGITIPQLTALGTWVAFNPPTRYSAVFPNKTQGPYVPDGAYPAVHPAHAVATIRRTA